MKNSTYATKIASRALQLALMAGLFILGGCAKDMSELNPGLGSGELLEVKVRLEGIDISETVAIKGEQKASNQPVMSRTKSVGSASDVMPVRVFSARLGNDKESQQAHLTKSTQQSVSTRATSAGFDNVWVFQFDADGRTLRCDNTGSLEAGAPLEAVLYAGTGYTIGVVANGPTDGLTKELVPDIDRFREDLLYDASAITADRIPYAGVLESVTVTDNGQIQTSESENATFRLQRVTAKVTLMVDYQVDGYTLDGVELYNVPAKIAYSVQQNTTDFPATDESNFTFTDTNVAGLTPHSTEGTNYTWYVGNNRRGVGSNITAEQDRHSANAPQYATFARIKTHYDGDPEMKLNYDVYLGSDDVADFNVYGNHDYNYTIAISGTAADQYRLLGTDLRVSGDNPMGDYTLSVSPDPTEGIAREGGVYTVILNNAIAEPISVRAIAEGGDEALAEGTLYNDKRQVKLTLPASELYTTRNIHFEYCDLQGEWQPIKSGQQKGYTVTPSGTIPSAIPQTGGTYTVTLTGDIPASVQVWTVIGSSKGTPAEITRSGMSVPFTIPANDTYDSRTVSFYYKWDGQDKLYKTVNQAGFGTPTAANTIPATIPQVGGSGYTVTLTSGSMPAIVPVQAVVGETVLAAANIKASGTPVTLPAIPANASFTQRTIVFRYEWNGKWQTIKSVAQPGYAAPTATTNVSSIPQAGGSYTVTLTKATNNSLPAAVPVRAIISGSSTVLASGTVTASGTAATLSPIGANESWSTRSVQIQYQWNGTWTNISTAKTQACYNVSATHNMTGLVSENGAEYTVTLSGTAIPNDLKVAVFDGERNTQLSVSTVVDGAKTVKVVVPKNTEYRRRPISIRIMKTSWQVVGTNQEQYRGPEADMTYNDVCGGYVKKFTPMTLTQATSIVTSCPGATTTDATSVIMAYGTAANAITAVAPAAMTWEGRTGYFVNPDLAILAWADPHPYVITWHEAPYNSYNVMNRWNLTGYGESIAAWVPFCIYPR